MRSYMSNLAWEISGQQGFQRLLFHRCDTAHLPSLAVALWRDGRLRWHGRQVSATQYEMAEELLKLYSALAYLSMDKEPELIATTEQTWPTGGGTDTAPIAP